MGILIDHNRRYTDEERAYLTARGRAYLIPANERRFGTNEEPRDPEPHEKYDSEAISPFYQAHDREAAVYDVGGAPLPGTTLDYDTGRVYDRDNGVEVEFVGPGHTPGASDLSQIRNYNEFDGYEVDENGNPVEEIDEDIVSEVTALKTKADVKLRLDELKVGYDSGATREQLEDSLAVALQDLRDSAEKA
jgi:hypothetical protein